MTVREPSYRLVSRDLLRQLMGRTGTGRNITIRALAARANCASSTIGNLLTGTQECVTSQTAHAISNAIGVDVLILFAPTGRSVPVPAGEIPPQPVQVAV